MGHDRTERTGSSRRRGAEHPSPFLVLALEAGRPGAGGARFALGDVDEVRVGRGNERQATRQGRVLLLQVPDKRMSAQHAVLAAREGGWVLEDSGSTNGSRVD